IDATVACHPSKPSFQMRGIIDCREVSVQLQKDILRELFRDTSITKKLIRQAEHHAFVTAHNLPERRRIALCRAFESLLHTLRLFGHDLLPTDVYATG